MFPFSPLASKEIDPKAAATRKTYFYKTKLSFSFLWQNVHNFEGPLGEEQGGIKLFFPQEQDFSR